MPIASSPTTGATHRRASRLLATALAMAAMVASADEQRPTEPPLDVALYIGRAKTDLDYPGARVPTRIDRIGIHWREQYQPLWLGLMGGGSYATQTQHPATAGLELGGYHVGITFELEVYTTPTMRVAFGGGYLYERVDAETSGNDVELAWHIPSAQLIARWRLAPTVELYGGARYDYVEGEERLRGATNSTLDIEHRAETTGIAGLRLDLDNTGYVMLEGNGGSTRGVALYFGRRY